MVNLAREKDKHANRMNTDSQNKPAQLLLWKVKLLTPETSFNH